MAHASTREKAIIKMRKIKELKQKKRIEENKIPEEIKLERNKKTTKQKLFSLIYDYEKHQMSVSKYNLFKELLKERLLEKDIKENEIEKINLILKDLEVNKNV